MNTWDPRYDAILYRPHPVSSVHPAMPLLDRAAQFAAFKALAGFEDEIEETGRYTDTAIELDDSRKESLDYRLRELVEHRGREAEFVWFAPDGKKAGGSYQRCKGAIKKIDPLQRSIFLTNGRTISLEQLCDIQGIDVPYD